MRDAIGASGGSLPGPAGDPRDRSRRGALGWLAYPFYDAARRRPRALVRLVAQLAIMAAASTFVQRAFAEVNEATEEHPNPEMIFAQGSMFMLSALVVLFSAWVAARYLDRRPLDGLGLRVQRGFWADTLFGVALGGALMAAILAAEVHLGLASYADAPEMRGEVPRLAYLPMAALAFTSVAIVEELVFRGYHLTNLAEGLTSRWLGPVSAVALAVMISSFGFGLAHAANPHASALSTGNIVMAGLMLAVGYVLTGDLAIPIGLHLGWNFFQNLFGMPVSGQTRFDYGALWQREVHGPAWITGGDFGPEAGMTGLVAMVAGTVAIFAWVRWRHGPLRVSGHFRGVP